LTVSASYPQVIVAHLGARLHYAVAVLLHRSGVLAQLFTDAYAAEGSFLHPVLKFVPPPLHRGWLKNLSQRVADLPSGKVTAYNLLGFRYAYALRKGSITDAYLRYNRAFCKRVSESKYLQQATIVYGFSGSSLELLEVAKAMGLICIVEQMIAPLRELVPILKKEQERWPGWQTVAELDWDECVWYSREEKEWELADFVVAPSDYVRSTLISSGVAPHKIMRIPYAVPADRFQGHERAFESKRPLHVLFVGSVSLRKGVPYLLHALRELGPEKVQAKLVGPVNLSRQKLFDYRDVAEIVGQVPRAEVPRYYNWADIFVMPSLCEGSATVTYEARSNGLPVIATPNAGAWVRDSHDGRLIQAGNAKALAESLCEFIRQPSLVSQMSCSALTSARSFSWEVYQQRLTDLVMSAASRPPAAALLPKSE
jgi:glycosyltransferase involved in cell wall biosynthesis